MTNQEAVEEAKGAGVDGVLLNRFLSEIKAKVPHYESAHPEVGIVNGTPLIDLTDDLLDFARDRFGFELSGRTVKVYGKLESKILGGSIKVRPAVSILEDAILSGRLRQGTTVFEATSGNFGIALGLMRSLGLEVVAIVSRRLQDGVFEELERVGVKTLNLDIDICPAPGLSANPGASLVAAVASSVEDQLAEYGFDPSLFEYSRREAEDLLSRGDAMGLAKLLARAYCGFCPQQYENELNVRSHETLTGPEIEQQLEQLSGSLSRFDLVCTFGTGGTSTGLSRYVKNAFGRRAVHVVFPKAGQDVAGIRSREKTFGLRFYEPDLYSSEREEDFGAAREVLEFFAARGYDVGESSALAIHATVQRIRRGEGDLFVVVLPDGIGKYRAAEDGTRLGKALEVECKEVVSNPEEFGRVVWTHPVFKPSRRAVELLASELGRAENDIRVAGPKDVESLYFREDITEEFKRLLPSDGKRALLVCVNGRTSLQLAHSLTEKGVAAASLKGGLTSLSAEGNEVPSELIELADA